MTSSLRSGCLAAAMTAILWCGSASAEPRRIVSLNPCLDTILLSVADREQIAALSHFALDRDSSTIADIAKDFPTTHESAEEVMSFNPDLVMTSRHSSLATRNALNRVNIRTELFTEPQSIAESLEQIRRIAAIVNRSERGEAVVAEIEAALKAAAPPPGTKPLSALIFQRNGLSTGSGSILNEMLARTGFTNAAGRYGLVWWGNIPLERVVADPPQMLLAGEVRPDTPTWADRVVRHPALQAIGPRMGRATFPDRLFYCAGPVLVKTAAALKAARESVTPEILP